MATTMTSSLKLGLDLPVWEWLRFQPAGNTAAGWSTCTSETGNDRYIYFLSNTAAPNSFFRYDTYSDSWQTLAAPNTALLTVGSMRYAAYAGHRCRALSTGTSTTIQIPALNGELFNGNQIKIVEGTGKGQIRTISDISDSVVIEQGLLTAASAVLLTDTTKKWKINQWAGYQVRIPFNAGTAQIRIILYNDETNLYLSDTNYQAYDSWNNTGFSAVLPFVVPVITANLQSSYWIESSTVTVSSPWTIIPDVSSRFIITSDGIWLMSSAAGAPFFTWQYYDVARDAWFTKTATATILAGALATDCAFEKYVESTGWFDSGSVSTGSTVFAPSASLVDDTKSWPIDRYVNYQVRIVSGSGLSQKRRIIAMSGSYLQTERNWETNPDTSSVYAIYGDTDKLNAIVGANSLMMQYHTEADIWSQGDIFYTGIARNMSAKWHNSSSYEPVGIAAINRYTGSIMSLAPTPIAGGSGYFVGDVFSITQASAGSGKGRVTSVGYSASLSSSVTGIEVYAAGVNYTPASGLATANILGTGAGLTVQILTTGSIGRVTSSMNHWFQKGDYVHFDGLSDNAWNITTQILGTDSLIAFDITASSLTPGTASAIQSNNTLVDCATSWSVNELVGKLVYKSLVGAAGTTEGKRIISNTSCSLTTVSIWAANPVTGTGRYVIADPQGFGRDEQYRNPVKNGRGYATAGTSSMLYDITKDWNYNQWTGSKVRIVAGTGINNEIQIFSNNANTMSFNASQSFSPDSSSKYIIMDTFGIATVGSATGLTDPTKNWATNMWAGKRVRLLSGTGISGEVLINTNTKNTLVWTSGITPSTDTNYVIYGPAVKGSGTSLTWAFGDTSPNTAGKYMWTSVGGGSNRFDKFNITTGLWDYGFYIQPISETLSTGTMFAYDGINRIYFTANSTGRVFYLDIMTNKVYPIGLTPFAQGVAVVGNRMEIVDTPDGLSFLIIFRHTGQEVWRTLLYI